MEYTELHCHSYYSFLDGTSSPADLAENASRFQLKGLALTDDNGLHGVIPFVKKCKEIGLPHVVGSLITVEHAKENSPPDEKILFLCQTIEGYQNLSQLITRAQGADVKSEVRATIEDINELSDGLICLVGKNSNVATFLQKDRIESAQKRLDVYRQIFGNNRLYIQLVNHLEPGDLPLCKQFCQLAQDFSLRYVATNGVRYATRREARLHDVLRCIAHKTCLDKSRSIHAPNHERYLKSAQEIQVLFSEIPAALKNTQVILERCNVELDFSQYRFPNFATPEGYDADSYLTTLCEESLSRKYNSINVEIKTKLNEELSLIKRLGLSGYFLVVWDIMKFARCKGIPAQGRGSAANSLVAYLLDITPVDPIAHNLVFGRFLNEEKTTIPDIDIDFASARDTRLADRDDVLDYVSRKYGFENVGLTSMFMTFGAKGAIREIGKVFGFPNSLLEKMSRFTEGRKNPDSAFSKIQELKQFDSYTKQKRWRHFRDQVQAVIGIPRHISTHPGGMIITSCELPKLVPLQPTRFQGRRICQWDKDMVEDAGLIKVDLLGLSMLAVIRECLILIAETYNLRLNLADIKTDDPEVYDMIEQADTVGLFQIESRVQIQTIPRTKPRNLSELAAQIAIIRPGPVQGKMVEPYIRRKQGLEPIRYPHPRLEPILKETLGVILFQEQILQVASTIAGYTSGAAENLRRDLDKKRSKKDLEMMQSKFVTAAVKNGVMKADATQIFDSIKGFAAYGFCKSHALAFAHLAYQSAWLKHYYEAVYFAALVNNQPMGFYPVSVIMNEAKRRGIQILPVDVNCSGVRCHLETAKSEAVRLSLTCVKGISTAKAESIVNIRQQDSFNSLKDFVLRTKLCVPNIENLIGAGAFDSFGLSRRELLWQLWIVHRWRDDSLVAPKLTPPPLKEMSPWSKLSWECNAQRFSIDAHPMQLLRPKLSSEVKRQDALRKLRNGVRTCVAGLVVCIQKPATAKGVAFMLLEDESGLLNVVISPTIYGKYRSIFKLAPCVRVYGILQREGGLISIQAKSFEELSFA